LERGVLERIIQSPAKICIASRSHYAVQFNHVPVHETHIAKVRKITTTSKNPSLNRTVTMRFRDGVIDVVGNCRRSATPNALLKLWFYSKVSLDVLPLWSRFWEFWA